MPYTLSTSLSSVPTDATVTRDAGGRVYINDTITLNTGAVVDVDLVCVAFVVPTGQTVTFGKTAADGTDIPISVVMTLAIAPYSQGAFHIVGNPTINVRNTTFHALNSSNMWGSWPGVVNTTGSILNATNMRIVLYSNLTTRTVNTTTADATTWIPGGGVIDGLEVAGVGSLFFNASPLSTKNIQQRDTPTRGISVASSGATAVDLVGVVAERVNVQQQPCFLRITNLRLLDNYVRNAATAGSSRFAIRKSIGGTLVGISADTRVSVWDQTANTLLHTRIGTAAFNPLTDCWRVYENNTTPVTAAQIESGVSAEAGSYVPSVRIAVLEYGRALAIRDYTLSIRQVGDDQPIDLSQILASSDVDESDAAVVAAWASIDTGSRFRDRAHLFLRQNWVGQNQEFVSLNGSLIDAGSYNVTIDATAAQAFAVAGNTITIKASTYTGDMTTTGLITLANGAQFVGTRTDANGTIAPPVLQSVTVSNGVAGTLLLIQDVTNPATPITLYLGTPSTWPHTWTDSADFVANRDIRVRAAYRSGTTAKLFVDELIGTSTYAAPALGYRLNQQDDTVYNVKAIDGSTVAGITINDTALLIEVTTGAIEWAELYAYEVYWLATAAGIIDEGRIITSKDPANYVFEGLWKIKNVSSPVVPLVISGGWGRSAADNTTQSLIDTTGGPIFAAPDQVYVTTITTSSGVITGDISQVPTAAQNAAAVLAAATSTPIHARVKIVNNTVLQGSGVAGDSMRPAD